MTYNGEWFAVDSDECLAIFDTGERGCVPEGAEIGRGAMDEFLAAFSDGTIGGVVYDVEDLMQGSGHKLEAHLKEGIPVWDLVAAASSEDALQELMKLSGAGRLPNPNTPLVYISSIECVDLERFLKDGSISKGWLGHPLMPERFGIFYYQCHNHETGDEYIREQTPRGSLKLSDIPAAWAQKFSKIRFDLNFADCPHVAPSDFFDCTEA